MTALEARRVVVRAGGRILIDGVDCTAPTGTLTALVGPNGAGKSTLLRALAAIDRPESGRVEADGSDLFALRRRERAKLAALVEQDAGTDLDSTVFDVVGLGRVPHEGLFGTEDQRGRDIVHEAMATTGTTGFEHRDFSTLSGGERQRVMLAKALAQQTPLLLLDEPTNHLDIAAQLATLQLLRGLTASGTTVIAALHDLTLAAAWAQHVIVVADGQVVAAGPSTDVLTASLVRSVYGVDTTVLTHPVTGAPVLAFSLPEHSLGLSADPKGNR
ncbi:ABC transporter ATP-binding protein [Amnibacterium flavum]|uniref:Iron ABC transporter ATP-binding protein n=1 Tax=Amnibacterium flavum TaxID=2173173 RepID=A0A2V1HUS3_9MICO|nr:ATP-binding cassette domain-containing protein [Amnibacterium flavum]PVZ96051.1 iron ABC transporter ATP-binding protein [Amnibacterium flavum]